MWRCANEIYIPKVNTLCENKVSDFRPIALLNVEGKLFFSLISNRLESHLIHNNNFINRSIQKGCMEKIPGCWEHISMVWSALKEARSSKSSLSAIRLDIKLIVFAFHRYGIPINWINLVESYYQGIFSNSFSQSAASKWHQHMRGIFQGCTLSIILFLVGMNIIIEYALQTDAPHFVSKNTSLPLIRAFMDDINVMSASASGA